MKNKLAKIVSIAVGVLMVVTGLICLFSPQITYLGIGYAIGIGMFLDAIGWIYSWWQGRKDKSSDALMLVSGILSAVFGLILIGNSAAQISVDVFVAYVAAIWILIRAAITIIRAFRARKFHKTLNTRVIGKHWWVRLIIGALMCVFAILSLMNPSIIMTAIGIFIGLGIIVAGADMLTTGIAMD